MARAPVQYLWSQIMGLGEGDGDAEVNKGMIALYDAMEARLRRDQENGHLHAEVHPRRLAVATWMAAHRESSTRSPSSTARTPPLSHGVRQIVDELARALTVGAYGATTAAR